MVSWLMYRHAWLARSSCLHMQITWPSRHPDQSLFRASHPRACVSHGLLAPSAFPRRIILAVNEISLYDKSASSQTRLIPAAAIRATMASATGRAPVAQIANCFDGDPTTSCTPSTAAANASLEVSYFCSSTGTTMGTLSGVELTLGPAGNATDLELVLRNKAGSVERTIAFRAPPGDRKFTFALDGFQGAAPS